jgi:ribosome-associated toxin RatA of RatAB toxin-antitoxin module
MINFSHSQKLNFPLKQFYKTITKVKNYKNFLPWCIDSYEKDHKIYNLTYKEIQNKFPELTKNIIISNHLNKLYNNNSNLINLKTYEGFIKVGFDLIEFSYLSKVYEISDKIILSITDDSQSHIFSKLESIWILDDEKNISKEKNEKEKAYNIDEINIDYNIQFKMKSILFSKITSICMSFLGENIVKSFISHTEKIIKEENENYLLDNFNLNNKDINNKEELNAYIYKKKKLENLIKNLFLNLNEDNLDLNLNLNFNSDIDIDKNTFISFSENESVKEFDTNNSNKLNEKIKNLFSYLIKENILNLEELEYLIKKMKFNISLKFQILHFLEIYDLNNSYQINYIGKDLKNFI